VKKTSRREFVDALMYGLRTVKYDAKDHDRIWRFSPEASRKSFSVATYVKQMLIYMYALRLNHIPI